MKGVAMGFPVDEAERQKLRDMLSGTAKLPGVSPGSTQMKCTECGMLLWMGPRVTETVVLGYAEPYCPLDGLAEGTRSGGLDLINLDNPDAIFEDGTKP